MADLPPTLLACRAVLVAVMAAAAVAKFRDREGFSGSLSDLGLTAAVPRRLAAVAVPAAETALAVLVLLPWTDTAGLVLAAVFCAGLTAVPLAVLARGRRVACACFGASAVPIGWWHVLRNAVLLAVAGTGAAVALHGAAGSVGGPGGVVALGAAAVVTVLIVFADDFAWLFGDLPAAAREGGNHG